MTWLPGRVLTRNQATTAMVLAETVAGGIGDHTDKRWLFIEAWADELGTTGADAVGKISLIWAASKARNYIPAVPPARAQLRRC